MRRDQGSIRARTKGRWEIRVELGSGPDGKRKRKIVQLKGNKIEANKKLRELLALQDKGFSLDVSKTTLGVFLEQWLTDYAETNTSQRTAQGYRGVVRRYLVPVLGGVPLVKLSPQHVQSLYTDMLGKGLSAQTVVHAHRVLREALKHGVKWGLLMRNVCDMADPPRPRRKEMATLVGADVQRFLDAASGSAYGAVFFLALYTGMRRSELMGLKWSAVDIHNKTISVTQTLIRITGKGLIATEPKSSRSRRLVSLPPAAVALLSGLRVKQREDRQSVGIETASDYVFSRFDGSLIDPDTITHAFADIIKKAGLPHVRFHDLRHTHATIMMEQGVNPKTVAERLGHASVVITLDTYSHVLPGLQEEAALKFEEAVRNSGERQGADGP